MRILDESQLEGMSSHVQRQLRQHIAKAEPAYDDEGRSKKRRDDPEQREGRMLIEWIDLLVLPNGLKPGLFFCHTPNGGFRNPTEAAIFYGQGLRKGWPDYTLYLPMQGYHGLVGELKAPDGRKPSEDQLEILSRLEAVGYKACVWWGFDDAKRDIEQYLDID